MENLENKDVPPLSSKNEENIETAESVSTQKDTLKKQKVASKTKKPFKYAWPIKVGILTLALALMFGVLSEMLLTDANIIITLLVIVALLVISIIFDMIGVAFAACPIEPLMSMASRKVKGSKRALNMAKNADKVSSFCSDVIGDICGILSGAAGAAITAKLVMNASGSKEVLIASIVSAIISALTVFGKAMFKKVAIEKSVNIVSLVGKILSVFSRKQK